MPMIPESNPAAALAFEAAVNRARARRLCDTPLPPRKPAEPVADASQPAGDSRDESRATHAA